MTILGDVIIAGAVTCASCVVIGVVGFVGLGAYFESKDAREKRKFAENVQKEIAKQATINFSPTDYVENNVNYETIEYEPPIAEDNSTFYQQRIDKTWF